MRLNSFFSRASVDAASFQGDLLDFSYNPRTMSPPKSSPNTAIARVLRTLAGKRNDDFHAIPAFP
jgi:hypothetical protein